MIDSNLAMSRDKRSLGSASGRDVRIEILCSCDEPYIPHAATMLCSLFEHNNVHRIHLLSESIAERELAKLKSLTARYGSELLFYEILPEDLRGVHLPPYWSIACYFRLLAARILPANIGKILYLDSDIIVRRPLTDLWNTELGDQAFAAVEDAFWDPKLDYVPLPPGAEYFNSGVMLINLNYWRRNNVYERAIAFIRDNPDKVNYVDQDALNAILINQWINLPAVWNDMALSTLPMPAVRNKLVENPAILHFVGPYKPWMWLCKHPYKYEYHKYRVKTPWRRYRLEGKPRLRFLRSIARLVLPGGLRQWLRSRIKTSLA